MGASGCEIYPRRYIEFIVRLSRYKRGVPWEYFGEASCSLPRTGEIVEAVWAAYLAEAGEGGGSKGRQEIAPSCDEPESTLAGPNFPSQQSDSLDSGVRSRRSLGRGPPVSRPRLRRYPRTTCFSAEQVKSVAGRGEYKRKRKAWLDRKTQDEEDPKGLLTLGDKKKRKLHVG